MADAIDWTTIRPAARAAHNSALKDYASLTKKETQQAFSYIRAWKDPSCYFMQQGVDGANWRMYRGTLDTLLWHEEVVSVQRKKHCDQVLTALSMRIRWHYSKKFLTVDKLGGVPLAFKSFVVVCDLFALLLLRRERHTDTAGDTFKAQSSERVDFWDPMEQFLSSMNNPRSPSAMSDAIFAKYIDEMLLLDDERFVRRVVGGASVVIACAVVDGVIDLSRVPEHFRTPAMRGIRPTCTKPRIATLGVPAHAQALRNEHRLTVRFANPECTLYVHIPFATHLENALDFAKTAHPELRAMLDATQVEYDLFWPKTLPLDCQEMTPEMKRSGRLAAVGRVRSDWSLNITLDALCVADLVDTINYEADRLLVNTRLDALLVDVPFLDGTTLIDLVLPNTRGGFECRAFKCKTAVGVTDKRASFKSELLATVSSMKKHVAARLDKHARFWRGAYARNPTRKQFEFLRNIAKIHPTTRVQA